jgi:DNA-binding SARP family transcriptional activator
LNRRTDDGDVITLQQVELGVLGPLQVRQYGLPVAIPGAKPRAILTMLGLHGGSVVSAGALVELLWGDAPPRTAAKALQTHISSLRRTLGDGFVLTEGTGWTLSTSEIDATRYKLAARLGRDAIAAGDASQAVSRFDEALTLWRGIPELPDGPRGVSEKTRWIESHAAAVEDRADALLATGRAAEIIGELEAAIADGRGIALLTVDGDLINRGEIFDEADIDAALARFEELSRLA